MPEVDNTNEKNRSHPSLDQHRNDNSTPYVDNSSSGRRSARDDESEVPFPSESGSSLDEVSSFPGRSLASRIAGAFGLTKKQKRRLEQILHSLNEYPSGYGKVAAIEDLDSDFLIFRKFGWLRNYSLLHLQDELSELQEELERLDKWEFRDGDHQTLLSRRKDYRKNTSGRKDLLLAIHNKLAQYDEALLRTQNIESIRRPTNRAQRNLNNLVNSTASLVDDESKWIREGPDLAALARGPEYSWLNVFFEDLFSIISKKATLFFFRNREQRIRSGDEDMRLLAADRFDILVRTTLTLLATLLMLAPITILYKVQPTSSADFQRTSNYQLITVFLFTLIFSVSCSLFTKARRQEVFAITAAYCAILVVFLGNTSNGIRN